VTVPRITAVQLAGSEELPLLVVGPSLGTSVSALWGEAAALLGDRFHVVGWDLPGHGRGTPTTEPFTLAEVAEGVLATVDAVRGDSPFVYAGDSVGGAVGLYLALAAPARVRGVAALCTGAVIGTPEGWAERAAQVRAAGTPSLIASSAQRWFAPGFTDRQPDAAGALLSSLQHADAESYALVCEALAAHDLRERLADVAVPLAAVGGTHDVAAPTDLQRALANGVPGAGFLELDGVAHLAPIEAPRAVVSVIDSLARGPIGTDVTPGDTIGPNSPDWSAGMRTRREVLGDAHVDRANAKITDVTRDFQSFITRYAWNDIWNRPGLARRDRSIAVLTALIAGRHFEELEFHLRAALTNGLTREEIVEVLLQSAVYVGVPAANTAFGVASKVLDEQPGA